MCVLVLPKYPFQPITGTYNNLYVGLSSSISLVQSAAQLYFKGATANTTVKTNVAVNTWYNIELRVDNVKYTLDAYIDGVLVGTDIACRSNNVMDRFWFTIGDTFLGEFYVDNFEVTNTLNIDSDVGDYTYFNSKEMNISTGSYANFTPYPKTNTLTCNPYDYTNKNRNDYIMMNKTISNQTDTDDCYFDIKIAKDSHYGSTKTYKTFLVEGDFKVDLLGPQIQMCLIKNVSLASYTIPAQIQSNGDLKYSDGTVTAGVAQVGQWFNYKMALDLSNHVADFYVNNVLVKANLPVSSSINDLGLVRVSLTSGSTPATMVVGNLKVHGLAQPYKNGVLTRTDVFADDAPIISFLKDKVAFHAYSGAMFANGSKTQLNPMPYYDKTNNLLYVTTDVLATALGINPSLLTVTSGSNVVTYNSVQYTLANAVTTSNSNVVVPVKDFATTVLSKYSNDDNYGLLIFSNYSVDLDLANESPYYLDLASKPSNVEYINDYMFFERPTAATLETNFNAVTNNGAMHPRLVATTSDFDRIKADRITNTKLNTIVTNLIAKADALLPDTVPVIDYVFDNPYTVRYAALDALERMKELGFAYQMTGDSKYVARAWKELQSLVAFPDFNFSLPIDAGDLCAGLAFGYDLMYDGFTPEQRTTIADALITLGLKPAQNAYYGGLTSSSMASVGWTYVNWTNNYNTVANGGAILAALAVAERDPSLCFDVIEKGLRSLEYPMKGLKPEGGWIEGADYLRDMVIPYLGYSLTALKTSAGTNAGFTKSMGLEGSAMYMISLAAAQGTNNYHDADTTSSVHPLTSWSVRWLAKEYNKPEYGNYRQLWLDWGNTPDVCDAVFFNTNTSLSALPLAWKTAGSESFSFRQSYSMISGMYASGHFGNVSGFHAHYDTGAFVFDVAGQRWGLDLGKDDYLSPLPANQLYRKRAEGHNVVVINPSTSAGQIDNKYAPITKFASNTGGGFTAADLTPVYSGVNSYLRGFYVGDSKRSLTIRDEMDLSASSTVYWFMHTKAVVTINNNVATLTQGGKSVKLSFITNATNATIGVMDAVGLPESQLPAGQKDNTGYRKIYIKLTGAVGPTDLTVKLAPIGEAAENTPILTTPISGW